MAIIMIFLMFADDIRILTIPKWLDPVFMSLYIVCFVFQIFDILFYFFAVKKYLFGFYFWIDSIAMLSLISDITWIWYPLTGLTDI